MQTPSWCGGDDFNQGFDVWPLLRVLVLEFRRQQGLLIGFVAFMLAD
jgi:hypothetical protein